MKSSNKSVSYSVYLAGRIEKRTQQSSKGYRWGLVNACLWASYDADGGKLKLIDYRPFEAAGRNFVYTGPYTLSDDHGGSHAPFSGVLSGDDLIIGGYGSRSHGSAPDITLCPNNHERDTNALYTFQRAMAGIGACDVFFVWLDDMEAYGSLVEIGYAKALGKHIVLAAPTSAQISATDSGNSRGELWFAHQAADQVVHGASANECFHNWAVNDAKLNWLKR